MEKVKLRLDGLNGNAFNLLGAFAATARQQDWSEQAIDAVLHEATAVGYDHLLQTLKAHTEDPEANA